MDYPRFREIGDRAARDGTHVPYLGHVDAQNHADRLSGDGRSRDWRNMGAEGYAGFYREMGWTALLTRTTSRGYLGPILLNRLERLALAPRHPWTMVPVENDWTVVLAFEKADDAELFRSFCR